MGEKLIKIVSYLNSKAPIPTLARQRVNLKVGKPVMTMPERFEDDPIILDIVLDAVAEVLDEPRKKIEKEIFAELTIGIKARIRAGAGTSMQENLGIHSPNREKIATTVATKPTISGFSWNAKYTTGIKIIDEQHKKLIEMIDSLSQAIRQGKSREILDEILDGLKEYVIIHFGTEERLMSKHAYPEMEKHKKEHDAFTSKVDDFIREWKETKSISVATKVFLFLKNWLNDHILVKDKEMCRFLKQKGES